MSLHTVAFMITFVLLIVLMFRRSSYGVALYFLTLYASPAIFAWGSPLAPLGVRWTLTAALILAIGVHLDGRPYKRNVRNDNLTVWWMIAFALNATFVHFFFASDPDRSWEGLVVLWKLVGLLYLAIKSVKDSFDLKVILYSVILGSAYIGYEVVVHHFGSTRDGRLWVIVGGMRGNLAAAFMCISLTIGGYLILFGSRIEQAITAVAMAFSVEVVLRAMSRATLLALGIGVAWLLLRTPGRARQFALLGILGAGIAAFIGTGQQQQVVAFQRFMTVFAPTETRDRSAESRLDFWVAGLEMVNDYPFGSGAEAAFESGRGNEYIQHLDYGEFRSVHNGYLDVAASWGVQGLLLFFGALFVSWRRLLAGIRTATRAGHVDAVFLGYSLETIIVVQLFISMFNANLKDEGYILWMLLCVGYARVVPALVADAKPAAKKKHEPFIPGELVGASAGG